MRGESKSMDGERRMSRLVVGASVLAGFVALTACTSVSNTGSAGKDGTSAPASSSTSSRQSGTSSRSSGVSPSPESHSTSVTGKSSSAGSLTPVPSRSGRTLPATPLRSPANFGQGVAAQIVSLKYGVVTDKGPGALAGRPTVTFKISLHNGSRNSIDNNTVQVIAKYGKNQTPAVPTNVQTTTPFSGKIAPGRSATGSYAFLIPVSGQREVRVEVWYHAGRPTVVFTGPARS